MSHRYASKPLLSVLRATALALVVIAAACSTGAQQKSQDAGARVGSSLPRVGTWLITDVDHAEVLCNFDTHPATVPYVHSGIQVSSWRQSTAHSSAFLLHDFQPWPWSVFEDNRTYTQYIALLESFPPDSPEGLWYRRLNDQVHSPLLAFPDEGSQAQNKIVFIYAHMFGYKQDFAIKRGLTPVAEASYAWPPEGLDGSWPRTFFHDDDGTGALGSRPSFKSPATRVAMANAVYFFMKHFESVGATVHFSPWREVNGYLSTTACPDDDDSRCGLDNWQDLYETYDAIVSRVAGGGFDQSRIALYPSMQLESFSMIDQRCVDAGVINQAKQFYSRNAKQGVPFAIGISTYPSAEEGALEKYRTRLDHLLDSLDSDSPVPCDADGDGVISQNEGLDPARSREGVRVPRESPLVIAETSRPPWLSFQALDTPSVMENERLGATMALTHLDYAYRTPDGAPAYPLEIIAFSLGANWNVPAFHGKKFWISSASGIARNWLSPMQPLAGQLVLDTAQDADGDWDNDGVQSITVNDLASSSSTRRKEAHFTLEEISYSMDNCAYSPNPEQADADADGIGDACDNCMNVANYPQEDWDQDGFGNACDPDINNDGLIQPEIDLTVVKQCQGAPIDCLAHVEFPDIPPGQTAPDLNGGVVLVADMDADEDIDAADVTAWWVLAANAHLRESGFACAGTAVCPDPSQVMLRNGRTVTIPDTAPYPLKCTAATAP